ncbi:hypothetical protein LTS08_000474 [Lithohypha guttulata]|nr:hypothetical protein LTS08_000474 [Lithohypha guttulata]
MATVRQRFLLTTAAFLLFSTATVRADWGSGFGGHGWGDDNDDRPGCWWGGGDCDGDDDDDDGDGDDDSSTTNPAQLGFTSEQINGYNRMITIHAVLACLVWVFLIPLGGILIRLGLKSPWIVRIHALLQSISYLIYVVAAALGIYLVRELSPRSGGMWQDPHTKLGIAILALAFLQPILGIVHHSLFKSRAAAAKAGTISKRPGRTVPGYIHLWLGRALIVLGMINGGLGLRLAAQSRFETNSRTKTIAYSVGAVIMFLLYLIFVVKGERRRSLERKQQSLDASRGGVPLMVRDNGAAMPPGYHQPPSYDESQESIMKEGQTTARYS